MPDLIVEENGQLIEYILRPAFDTVCQAAGCTGSPNYDENGNWQGGNWRGE